MGVSYRHRRRARFYDQIRRHGRASHELVHMSQAIAADAEAPDQ
jgi:hypothetical protein